MVEGEEICTDEYMQLDYIRVFVEDERFQEMDSEISGILTQTQQSIMKLDQKGENITQLEAEYGKAQANWQENHYLFCSAKKHLETINNALGHWDEISEMFAQARGQIEAAVNAGMDTVSMERNYGYAEKAWSKLEYGVTQWYLQNILDIKISEPTILSILSMFGLILTITSRLR
jgi:hypothetical protein